MADFQWGPLATIIGSILSAGAAASATYAWMYKRKSLEISIFKPEEVSRYLRQHAKTISIKFADKDLLELNRSLVVVRNTGNTVIKDFSADLYLPGDRSFFTADLNIDDRHPVANVTFERIGDDLSRSPTFKCKVPFINVREKFEIVLWFDAVLDRPKVACRLEEVSVKIIDQATNDDLREQTISSFWSKIIQGAAAAAVIFGVAGAASGYLFATSESRKSEIELLKAQNTKNMKELLDALDKAGQDTPKTLPKIQNYKIDPPPR